MSETLEEKARRIGDDVSAIWAHLQSKGAMIPHSLNTENIIDVIPQYTSIDKWSSRGLFMYNYTGDYYDFYTTHEVNRMTELPPAPEGATGWPMTLAEVKSALEHSSYIIMVAEGALEAEFLLTLELDDATKLTPEFMCYITDLTDIYIVNWGDGTSTAINQDGWFKQTHTYATTGTYNIVVQLDSTAKLHLGQYESYSGLSAPNVLGSSADNYKKFMTSFMAGSRTVLHEYAFSPNATSVWGYSDISLTGLCRADIDSSITAVPDGCFIYSNFKYFPISNYITTIGAKAFSGSNFENGFSLPDGAKIGDAAFQRCKIFLDSLDLRNVAVIGSGAFLGIKTGAQGYIKEVILPENDSVFSDYNRSLFEGAGVERVIIPEGLTVIPESIFAPGLETGKVLTDIQFSSTVREIGANAFQSYVGDGSNITLPNGLEVLSGFSSAWNSGSSSTPGLSLNIPSSVHTFGVSAFAMRTLAAGFQIPSTVTDLGQKAFSSARIRGTEFVVPPTVTSVYNGEVCYRTMCERIVFNPSISTLQGAMCREVRAKQLVYGSNLSTFAYLNQGVCGYSRGLDPVNGVDSTFSDSDPFIMEYTELQGDNITLSQNCFRNVMSYKIIFDHNVSTIDGRRDFYLFGNAPASVTSVTYDIDFSNCTSVPTVNYPNGPSASYPTFYVNASKNIQPRIIVPDALYNDWIAASGWDVWSTYIVKASQI